MPFNVALFRPRPIKEIEAHRKGVQNETQSRLNQIPQPSLLSTVTSVGATGISAYHKFFPPNVLAIPIDQMNYARAGVVQ
jgi:hypothetical protein